MKIEVEEIKKLVLNEGDMLVVYFPKDMSIAQMQEYTDHIKANLPANCGVMGLPSDYKLETIGGGEPCPSCEVKPIAPDDYLCQECRWGEDVRKG